MISVANLSRAFGSRQILREISFTVEPGEIIGFVGANGSGKTTTMRLIMGLLAYDQGLIEIDGHKQDGDRNLSRILGYMPEERGLYLNQTLYSQLQFFGELQGMSRSEARKSIAELLSKLDIEGYAYYKLGELSLGNQQRAQLAVSLLHRPRYLILDEPFSGLDPMGIEALIRILTEASQSGVGIIFSSHILPFVEEMSEKILVLSGGSIHRYLGGYEKLSDFYKRLVAKNV